MTGAEISSLLDGLFGLAAGNSFCKQCGVGRGERNVKLKCMWMLSKADACLNLNKGAKRVSSENKQSCLNSSHSSTLRCYQ